MERVREKAFFVGDARIEPALNRVVRGGETVRLTPKAMQVLVALARRPGAVVSRDALLETIWAGTVVNDDVVTRAISDLRRAFADDAQAPQVIETISKSGYRLIAPVTHPYAGDATPAHAGDSAPGAMPGAIAHASDLPTLAFPEPVLTPRPRRRAATVLGAGLAAAGVLAAVLVVAGRMGAPAPAAAPPVPLTSLPGREVRPAVSPDGRQVAFTWRGPAGDNADLYVQLTSGGPPLRLTDDPDDDIGAAWSPDGTRLAFMRHTDDACALYVVPALGGPETHLGSCGANVNPDLAWSPDGRWLAYSDRPAPEASFAVVLVSPSDGTRRWLTTPPDQHWGDRDPAFSPDGAEVAFVRSISMYTQDVFVAPVDGGMPRRVTHDAAPVSGVAWADDGRLVFTSGRMGSLNLWTVPARGGAPAWIAAAGLEAMRPSVARGAGPLVFEQRHVRAALWRMASGETAPAPWLPSTRQDLHPAFAPDGRRVAFVSDRSGRFEVWVSDAEGASPLRLTDFGGPFVSAPHWSPDGTRLAFDARPDGQADVYVVDAAGGRALRLTSGASHEVAPAWSPDGRWLYFGSNRSGTWQIWRQPAGAGTEGAAVAVTRTGGYVALPSPDGQWLYVMKYDRPGLWRMPADPAAPVPEALIPGTEAIRGWRNWLVTADAVFFARPADDGTEVCRLDLAGGPVEVVAMLPGRPYANGLARSPDGRLFVVATEELTESDLLLLERF